MAAPPGGLTRFYTLLGALALILATGVIALLVTGRRQKAAPPPAEGPGVVVPDDGFEGYAKGSPDAPVEVVEYSDFECPFCAQLAVVQLPDIDRRLIAIGRLRWRFRDFPLDIHEHARLAARAAHCAGEEGRFWEMHDALLWKQRAWAGRRGADGKFEAYAKEIGLDSRAFGACLRSTKYDARIEASVAEGRALGVSGTPTLFVNGRRLDRPPTADELVRIVDSIAPPAR